MSFSLLTWMVFRGKASERKAHFSVNYSNTPSSGLSQITWGFSGLGGQDKRSPSSLVIIPAAMLPKWVLCWAELIAAFHLYFLERGFVAECPADSALLETSGPKKQHAKVMGGVNPQAGLPWLCHSDGSTQTPLGLAEEVSLASGPVQRQKETQGGETSKYQVWVRGGVTIPASHAKLPGFSPKRLWKWPMCMSPLTVLWIFVSWGLLKPWLSQGLPPKDSYHHECNETPKLSHNSWCTPENQVSSRSLVCLTNVLDLALFLSLWLCPILLEQKELQF